MSTNNALGYCPSCKQNVLLVRDAANWALIILLIIFTGGIGLIVYAIIYFNKSPNRCIHCHSQLSFNSTSSGQISNFKRNGAHLKTESDSDDINSLDVDKESKQRFCSFCGEPLSNKEAKFCAHCGTNV
ncbi:MAG: hypothetical protein ACFE96_15160 [Candidatus Hermodarchaeota archaeon]